MKIGNIGRLDPSLKEKGISGLTHGAKLEEEVWEMFTDDPDGLSYESEQLIAKLAKLDLLDKVDLTNLPDGIDKEVVVKQRVNQGFFRAAVLSSYNYRCCISGITTPQLIEACHISGWANDIMNRTNPTNGLCLNSLFHKAYDAHLISISPDLTVGVSDILIDQTMDEETKKYLKSLRGRHMSLPNKFSPNKGLLEEHYIAFKQNGR